MEVESHSMNSLCVWLFQLSTRVLSIIHAAAYMGMFLLIAEENSVVRTHRCFFVLPPLMDIRAVSIWDYNEESCYAHLGSDLRECYVFILFLTLHFPQSDLNRVLLTS